MPLNPQKIRALCFDVDGTLRDTDDTYVHRFTRTFTRMGWMFPRRDPALTARRFVMTLDTPINAVYTALDWIGLDAPMIAFLDYLNKLNLRKEKASLPLIPGVRPALESLSHKYPMAVVSARGEKGTREFLAYHQLEKYFVCIASGQTTKHTKPWPDPILWSAEQIGVPPESCLMIGDTTVDIRAGRAAGCQTVGVLSGFGDEKELSRAGADLLLESVAQLETSLDF
ncbi:MAG TPA: HAD family hydrolase [Anaerolineales bacterium]|nr:HAD family hydrolase [Anaerolineales bacterium]